MGSTIIQPRTLRGFADTMPWVASHRRRMLAVIEETYSSFGYDPIQTPAVEYAEILKGKGGTESDKQMFEFDDQGGRRVALRFDLTVPLARYVAQHESRLRLPFRAYHIGQVWRGERPQRGRFREFLQCDADIIGVTGLTADAEILSIVQTAMEDMEIGRFVIRINNRHILNGLLADLRLGDRIMPVLRALDKIEKIGEAGVVAELAAAGVDGAAVDRILGLIQSRGGSNSETLDAVANLVGSGEEANQGLTELREIIDLVTIATGRDDRVRYDPSIVRGLDYYTGMVYEVMHLDAPDVGSIGGGGRYDNLAGLYTTSQLPGVGGTIGVTRILAALENLDRLSTTARQRPLVVITQDPTSDRRGLVGLAAAVRATGLFDVDLYPGDAKHSAQMKYGDGRGARFVLTLDSDGSVSIKDMVSGARSSAPVSEASDVLVKLNG
jgi:histidyl-tRNA synthetase